MEINLKKIKVKDVFEGYVDNDEEGVKGFGGRLDIRPKYQREFIYNDEKRNAVIDTVLKGYPLNVMYWVANSSDNLEVLDGQQRTISLCQYLNGDFSYNGKYFHSLTPDKQEKIKNYELNIYICSNGTDSEKLEWFKTINIAGEKLTDQELRNAVYAGPWLSSAKKYFSKTNCPAHQIGDDYMTGSPIRQDILEKVLKWISNNNIEDYMSTHQFDKDALELWEYFQKVIEWVRSTFIVYRKEMKNVAWGDLYNKYSYMKLDPQFLETEVSRLMADDDVTKKTGIYDDYIFSKNENKLSIRAFTENMKREAYERQNGICPACGKHYKLEEMEADHITPWSKGGKTIAENCQMLCKNDNRLKSNI